MREPSLPSARLLASIRQLCCLDYPEELLVPKLLAAVGEWIGADTRHFIWSDPHTQLPANYTGDGFATPDVMQRYFTHNSRVDYPGLVPAFPQLMRTFSSGTFGCEGAIDTYLNSDMYNEVLRHVGGRFMMYMIVRDLNDVPRGHLSFLRGPGNRPFSRHEVAQLAGLQPYLRHAFATKSDAAPAHEVCDGEGMAVLDGRGTLLYQDVQAQRLFWMAGHERINAGVLQDFGHGMTTHLRLLYHRFAANMQMRSAPPPAFERRNAWGRFVFRATALHGAGEARVGVRVTHYIPRQLKAWESLHRLGLSPRQQQVALLFSESRTVPEIAATLGISRNTAAEYVETMYQRLGIEPNREALQNLLMSR